MKKPLRKWLIPALSILTAIAVLLIAGYGVMNARTFQFGGRLVSQVETGRKVVYLTFDDGPTEKTGRILEVLAALDVKASFFLTGRQMEEGPAWAKAIYDAGHDIGNHTYSHSRMVFQPLSHIQSEVERTNGIIRSLGYEREIFFRAPGCKKLFLLPWYLGQTGQASVTWTLEPDSYADTNRDAQSMADYTLANASNGAIILLHPMNDGTDKTLDAIRLIVTGLREKGYSFERLSEGINDLSPAKYR